MAEDAECRAEKEQPEVAFRYASSRVDDDLAVATHEIARGVPDGQKDGIA